MKESSSKLNNLAFESIQRCFSKLKNDDLVKLYKDLLLVSKQKKIDDFKISGFDESNIQRKKILNLLSSKVKGFENGSIPDFLEAYLYLSVGNDGRAYKIMSNLVKKPLNRSIFESASSEVSPHEYETLDIIVKYFYSKMKRKFVDLICAHLLSVDYNIYSGERVQSCSNVNKSDLARFIYSPNYGKRYPSLWLNTPFNLSEKNRNIFFQQSNLYEKMQEKDLSSWLVFQKYKIHTKKERKLLKSFLTNSDKQSDLYMDVLFRLSESENRYLLKQLGYSNVFSLNKKRSFYMKLLKNKKTYLYGLINLIILNDYSLDHVNNDFLN